MNMNARCFYEKNYKENKFSELHIANNMIMCQGKVLLKKN